MAAYSICKTIENNCVISQKAVEVMRMFGLTRDRVRANRVTYDFEVEIKQGDIVYITGPSGAGKTVLLKELEKRIPEPERVNLNEIGLAEDKTLIDCIGGGFMEGLGLLSIAGLNDVFCVLNRPAFLSDGQKYRFRLAMALAMGKKFVISDEFCSNLDRITAAVISYNVRKFAKKHGVTFILAGSHEDMLCDLAPDVLVVKELCGATQVIYK